MRNHILGAATMMRHLAWVSSALLLALCGGCASPEAVQRAQEEKTATKAAQDFVTRFKAPTEENQAAWGLTNLHVFRTGNIQVERAAYSPQVLEARVSLWCSGQNDQGQAVQRQRTLVARINPGTGVVVSHEFVEDQPLTFGTQALRWVWWSYGFPLALACILFALFVMLGSGWPEGALVLLGVGLAAVAVFAVGFAGYAAYTLFDNSVLAAMLGVPLYLITAIPLVAGIVGGYLKLGKRYPQALTLVNWVLFGVFFVIGLASMDGGFHFPW